VVSNVLRRRGAGHNPGDHIPGHGTKTTFVLPIHGTPMPSKDEQIALLKNSWHDFAVSVNAKSMEHFHNTISSAWKSQFNVQEFNETFGSVFATGLNLTILDPLVPMFDGEPTIDENGMLWIKGHYATTPKQINYEHKFIYEGTAWKLFGFKFNTK
jgi:hypothetical protein